VAFWNNIAGNGIQTLSCGRDRISRMGMTRNLQSTIRFPLPQRITCRTVTPSYHTIYCVFAIIKRNISYLWISRFLFYRNFSVFLQIFSLLAFIKNKMEKDECAMYIRACTIERMNITSRWEHLHSPNSHIGWWIIFPQKIL